jgi:hypothetical protein
MIWLVTAGRAGQPGLRLRAAFSASMAAAFGAPPQRDKKHRLPSSYSIPSRTVPAVRGLPAEQSTPLLALFSAKNIPRTKRRCLIAY